jgi:type III secretion system FlhB-like substrate exporter
MKKSNIAFLFQKHEAKKVATQTAPPISDADEELSIPIVEDPLIVSVESGIVALAVDEGTETPTVVATGTTIATTDEVEEEEEEEPPLAAADDVDSLEHDPGESP